MLCECGCGKRVKGSRKDARFASASCRSRARRQRIQAHKRAQEMTTTFEAAAEVERLGKVLPKTATAVREAAAVHGMDVVKSMVELCMKAVAEAAASYEFAERNSA